MKRIVLLIIIILLLTLSFATDLEVSSIQDLGMWIDAKTQGSYYANLPSMLRDDSGKIHTTYCSSSEPFNQNYAPDWRETAIYSTDSIRHQQSDDNGITWTNANKIISAGTDDHFWSYSPDWKIERNWSDGYFWEDSEKYGAWIGYQKSEDSSIGTGWGTIMRTQENLFQAPCANVLMYYKGKYYIYFESYSSPSGILSIYVGRSNLPQGPYEIWTYDGWKTSPTNYTWKPVITPNIVTIAGDEYVAEQYKKPGHGNPYNVLYGAGWPRGITQKNGKIYLYYIDTTYWFVWKDAQGNIHEYDRNSDQQIPYQLVAIGEDPTNFENVYDNRMVDSSGTELWNTFSPKYFPEQSKFYNFELNEITGENNIVYRSSDNGIIWSDEKILGATSITEKINHDQPQNNIIEVSNNLIPLSNKNGQANFSDLYLLYIKEHILPNALTGWQDTPDFKWFYGGVDLYGLKINLSALTTPLCTEQNWTSTDGTCQSNNTLTRTWTKSGTCTGGVTHSQTETTTCNYQAPTCTNFTYSDWTPTTCPQSTTQTRTIQTTTPTTCQNGNPESLTRTCTYIPTCTDDHWTSTDGTCQNTNTLIRTWYKTNNCQNGIQKPTTESVSCDYQAPTCTNFTYTNWTPTTCPQTGTQTKTILTKTPTTCHGGNPDALIRSCTHTPICTDDHWDFDLEPATCPSIGEQTKKYFKVTNCQNGITKTDEIILCNYNAPQCQYTYSNYGTCANGIETRTATLTTVETCQGQPIDLTKTCETIPTCTDSHWSFEMTPCTNGTQTKQWTKINDCNNGIIYANEIITCDAEQEQPEYCNQDDWESRIEPAVCPETGTQTKHWTRTNTDCQGGVTHKAQETISCTPKETNNIPDIIRCQTNDDCTGNQECILNECAQVYYPDGLPQNLPNQPDPTPPPTNNQTIYDFTTTEIIEKINNSQDDEAITLLQQAEQSINAGEETKATAQINIALLKTKTIEEPELIIQYEQAILALNQDNYETANQLALDAMDPPVKQQDFETILTIIAVLIIIIVVLIIFGRRK